MPTYAKIVVLRKGVATGSEFLLRKRTCTIGSVKDCEICIKRDEVQEKHAKIEVQNVSNFLYITNIAYNGGVLVNEKEMLANQKLQLANKDVITVCGRSFLVDIPEDLGNKENTSENVGLATPPVVEILENEKDIKEKEDRPIKEKNSNTPKEGEGKKPKEGKKTSAEKAAEDKADKEVKPSAKKEAKNELKKEEKKRQKRRQTARRKRRIRK